MFIVPPTENPATQIESVLASGNLGLTLRLSDKLVATSKRSLLGWISRARSNLGLGRICDADEDLDVAIRLAPDDAQANLLRGMVDQRLGRIDRAVDRLRKLAASKSPYAIEASVMFAETLYFSRRRDEFRKFVEAGGAWANDARGPLMTARVRAGAVCFHVARDPRDMAISTFFHSSIQSPMVGLARSIHCAV